MSAELENMRALARKFQAAGIFDRESAALALAAGFLEWAEALEQKLDLLEKLDGTK